MIGPIVLVVLLAALPADNGQAKTDPKSKLEKRDGEKAGGKAEDAAPTKDGAKPEGGSRAPPGQTPAPTPAAVRPSKDAPPPRPLPQFKDPDALPKFQEGLKKM